MRILLALAALGLSVPAHAAPLAPTGKWVVNFDDAQCVATRAYGDQRIFLKAAPSGDVVQFGIISPGGSGLPEQVPLTMAPAGAATEKVTALRWIQGTGPGRQTYLLTNLTSERFAAIENATSVSLYNSDIQRHYQLSGLAPLRKVMNDCLTDLQALWPINPGGTGARGRLTDFITSDDYPPQANDEDITGTTRMVLLVDETGRVADCSITATSGAAILDVQACSLLKARARLTPATDATGKPAKGRLTTAIRWQLPRRRLQSESRSR
jgi:TonB family protein